MLFPVKNNLDIGILKDFSDCIPVSGDNLFSTNKEISFISFIHFFSICFVSFHQLCPMIVLCPMPRWWLRGHRSKSGG